MANPGGDTSVGDRTGNVVAQLKELGDMACSNADARSDSLFSSSSELDEALPNSDRIRNGDDIVIQFQDGSFTVSKVTSTATTRLGTKKCKLRDVVGHKFGSVFEQRGGKLVAVDRDPTKPVNIDDFDEAGEGEKEEADHRVNDSYVDTGDSQKLSHQDVEEMKIQGMEGTKIVQSLISNLSTWEKKGKRCKEKYLVKKIRRVWKCTSFTLCKAFFTRHPDKILWLREDTLAMMLHYADLAHNQQVGVVETVHGLLVGGVMERLGGAGRVISLVESGSSNLILEEHQAYRDWADTVVSLPIIELGKLQQTEAEIAEIEDANKPTEEQIEKRLIEREMKLKAAPADVQKKIKKSTQKKQRQLERRKEMHTKAQRREWLREGFDSLLIASKYDPEEILFRLIPYLHGSRPFVVYCRYMEPLTKCFQRLKESERAINMSIMSAFFRDYQVLPGRTHPENSMRESGGFILRGVRIYNDREIEALENEAQNTSSRDAGLNSENGETKNDIVTEEECISQSKRRKI